MHAYLHTGRRARLLQHQAHRLGYARQHRDSFPRQIAPGKVLRRVDGVQQRTSIRGQGDAQRRCRGRGLARAFRRYGAGRTGHACRRAWLCFCRWHDDCLLFDVFTGNSTPWHAKKITNRERLPVRTRWCSLPHTYALKARLQACPLRALPRATRHCRPQVSRCPSQTTR